MVRPLDKRPARRHKVYVLRDMAGRYMYLGLTSEPLQRRLDRHARQDPEWFGAIDLQNVTVKLYADREDAERELARRRALTRQPYVNPADRARLDGVRTARPHRNILERISDARNELREAEQAFGYPPGSAIRDEHGNIDWDIDKLRAAGLW